MHPVATAATCETYRYAAQGWRAIKLIHSQQQKKYLPALEMRCTELQLRVIVLPEARIFQQRQGHQTRFSCVNLSGSVCAELDSDGQLLSQEHYYPFGGTACWASSSLLTATNKICRYAGHERDLTGLVYYGFRYYAPWLRRWLNPDPAGSVDGLNFLAFIGNNPISWQDLMGLARHCGYQSTLKCRICHRWFSQTDMKNHRETAHPPPPRQPPQNPNPLPENLPPDEPCPQETINTLNTRFRSTVTDLTAASCSHEQQPTKATASGDDGAVTRPARLQIIITDAGYHCPIDDCDKTFKKSRGVREHIPRHSAEKPFKCDNEGCDKAFRDRRQLEQHLPVHSEERPFPCLIEGCDKRFKRSADMRAHQRFHKPRTHICHTNGCTKVFRTNKDLRRHQQRRHK